MDWELKAALLSLGVSEETIERAIVRAERIRRRYEGVDGAKFYVPCTQEYTAWMWLGMKPSHDRRIKELGE